MTWTRSEGGVRPIDPAAAGIHASRRDAVVQKAEGLVLPEIEAVEGAAAAQHPKREREIGGLRLWIEQQDGEPSADQRCDQNPPGRWCVGLAGEGREDPLEDRETLVTQGVDVVREGEQAASQASDRCARARLCQGAVGDPERTRCQEPETLVGEGEIEVAGAGWGAPVHAARIGEAHRGSEGRAARDQERAGLELLSGLGEPRAVARYVGRGLSFDHLDPIRLQALEPIAPPRWRPGGGAPPGHAGVHLQTGPSYPVHQQRAPGGAHREPGPIRLDDSARGKGPIAQRVHRLQTGGLGRRASRAPSASRPAAPW